MAAAEVLANQPVVIDNGSGLLKAGFAGEEVPKLVFPNYVGYAKHTKIMPSGPEVERFVGARAEELRGLLKIRYPLVHGVVQPHAWDDMEALWKQTFADLKVAPDQHPVLLTEPPLNPRRNREKGAQVFFESFGTPALFFSMQAVLSLYASGRTTGVVLDVGDGVSHAVPVFEGYAMSHSIMRINLAGREVTEYLQLLLRKAGHDFHTSSEREVVKAIKETTCYVAYDPQKEEDQLGTEGSRAKPAMVPYKLPDGTTIEVLFRPELIGEEYPGLAELVTTSIGRADLDLRRSLYAKIVLSGGSTLFPGFGERFLSEVRSLAPKDIKIRISAPPERKYSTWIGGSILANLPTFKKLWVSKAEYDEEGVSIIHKKTF